MIAPDRQCAKNSFKGILPRPKSWTPSATEGTRIGEKRRNDARSVAKTMEFRRKARQVVAEQRVLLAGPFPIGKLCLSAPIRHRPSNRRARAPAAVGPRRGPRGPVQKRIGKTDDARRKQKKKNTEKKKIRRGATRGLPRRSPILVLLSPKHA